MLKHQGGWLGAEGGAGGDAAMPVGARILHVLHDLIAAEVAAGDTQSAIAALRQRAARYDPAVLQALTDVCEVPEPEVRALALRELRAGMVLADDVKLETGMMIVARGQRLTEHLLLRLNNFHARRLREPILCEIPHEIATAMAKEASQR